MAKRRTYRQVETAKGRAVRFFENVLDDSDRAEEVEDESVEDYAARRGIQIVENPLGAELLVSALVGVVSKSTTRKVPIMATKAELQDAVDQVSDKISELLDPVLDRKEIVAKLQELDEMLNGGDDDEEEEIEEEDEDDSAT